MTVSPLATSFSSLGSNLKPPDPALTVWTCGALLDDELVAELVGDGLGADVMLASDEVADGVPVGAALDGGAEDMTKSLNDASLLSDGRFEESSQSPQKVFPTQSAQSYPNPHQSLASAKLLSNEAVANPVSGLVFSQLTITPKESASNQQMTGTTKGNGLG